ncbi:hypothetical protein [Deinococcus sp. Leaf326]|uniref:hypothetical protein n=1 Tax=Deinococcus sp. Leaf326 TaxID=1736338 RepID=UPI000701C8D1|nr:hypothetical protein [Deinococcus sp. Leaf326]KQR33113.1 hypothetical protein ASF71_16615 [Deinococcus sp. Leaf326]
MAKLIPITGRVLLPPGSTGGPVKLEHAAPYRVAAQMAGGRYDGWAVRVDGQWAEIHEGKTADTPFLKAFAPELGDPLTSLVTVTVTPEGPGVRALPIVIKGHPRDTGGGGWDLSAFGLVPGETLISEEQRLNVVEALAQTQVQQEQVAAAVVQAADVTEQARTSAALRSLGREPHAGDPAGLYRWVSPQGDVLDIAWSGTAETGRTVALASGARASALEDAMLRAADITERERIGSINIQTRIVVNVLNYLRGNGQLEDNNAYYRFMLEIAAARRALWPDALFRLAPQYQMNIPAGSVHDFSNGRARIIIDPSTTIPAQDAIFCAQGAADVALYGLNISGDYTNQTRRFKAVAAVRAARFGLHDATIQDFGDMGAYLSGCLAWQVENARISRCGRKKPGESGGFPGFEATTDLGLSAAQIAAGWDGRDGRLIGGFFEDCGLDGAAIGTPNALVDGIRTRRNGFDEDGVGAAGFYFYRLAHNLTVRNAIAEDNAANGFDTGPNLAEYIRDVLFENIQARRNRSSGLQLDYVAGVTVDKAVLEDNNYGNVSPTRQVNGLTLATSGGATGIKLREVRSTDTRGSGKTQQYGLGISVPDAAGNPTTAALMVGNLDIRGCYFGGNAKGEIGSYNTSVPASLHNVGYTSMAQNSFVPTVKAAVTTAGYAAHIPVTATLVKINPEEATTFRGMTKGAPDDVVTLFFENNLATLAQELGGTYPVGNWRLAGYQDVTPPAGARISFAFDGFNWLEQSRTF